MALFWKSAAGVLIAVVLVLALGKQEKDLALLLSMAVCAMVMITAVTLLEPVLEFFRRLETLGDLRSGILGTLLKIVGIGLVSEIAAMICQDSGNGSLGHGIRLLGSVVMLRLSLPVLETLLEMVQTILGEL